MSSNLALATAPADTVRRHTGEGHGRRLTAAFDALALFPALVESRDSILRVVGKLRVSPGEVVAAVESDAALVTMVLRMANRMDSKRRGRIATVPEAVALLTPEGVEQLARGARVFDFFSSAPGWDHEPERFRIHAIAVQVAADQLACELNYVRRDELLAAAVLHDIGKLVLLHAYPGYPEEVHGDARTPEERIRRERLALGVDHATVGGVLARRWGLPAILASAIENHHAPGAIGDAAFLRVADMLAHYGHGDPVDPTELSAAARSIRLNPQRLRAIMFALPGANPERHVDPCPLTRCEKDVLKHLATGQSCGEIGYQLGRSASTVRSHLHNTYKKLGVVDRSQAVLMATAHGWL